MTTDLKSLKRHEYPNYRRSGYHLILNWPTKLYWPGVSDDEHRFVDSTKIEKSFYERRAGLTWPTPHNEGYFCIMGWLDTRRVTPTGRKPVELLHETKTRSRAQLFKRIAAAMKITNCRWLLCDCSPRYDILYHDFTRYMDRMNIDYIEPFDIADESGYLEAMTAIDDLLEYDFLRLDRAHVDDIVTIKSGANPYERKPASMLKLEMANISPDDLHSINHTTTEQRFPAVQALNHVITSIELYPWSKPEPDLPDTDFRREGYA